MPLPLPNLDDRRWADLIEEGRALIPRYAPRWTDHNVHDPGITLIELFAWLTEMTVYRLNRLPERHRRKFLALTGFRPQPPWAAQTVLAFTPDEQTVLALAPHEGPPLFAVPAAAEFEATDPEGQPVLFRTLRDLDVSVVTLAAVQVEAFDEKGKLVFHDWTRDLREGLPIAALGKNPHPGEGLYLGFSELPPRTPVALALRFQGPGNDAAERSRIVREAVAQRAACRHILPDIPCPEGKDHRQEPVETLPPHHSVHIVWEAYTGPGSEDWRPLEPVMMPAQPGIDQVIDDTRSLTLDGIIELNLPDSIARTERGEVADALFYVRCRLVSGAYDAPPMLLDIAPNSVAAEQAVPVFQTLTIPADITPDGSSPSDGTTTRLRMQLDSAGIVQTLAFDPSAAEPSATTGPDVLVLSYEKPERMAPGQITLELVLVGRSNGRPEQRLTLPQAPVQIESFRLFTHTGGAWQEWTRRDDLDASARTDFHFVLDPMSGEIAFGNGERGSVPQADALIFATYRATRAAMGNVAAGTVIRPAKSPRNALWLDKLERELGADLRTEVEAQLPRITTNRMPASGGAAAEELSAAIGRAVDTLHAHERLLDLCGETKCQTFDQLERRRVRALPAPTRAVNLLDLERLALDVPGTRVARVRVWAAVHPDYPCLQAPGVVTVVVVPDMPVARPEPSQGLLQAIKRFLDRRRVVATRVEVVGPHYLEVSVRARIRTRAHTDAARVRAQVRHALNAFLDPRSGGPDRFGWPFGRDVYRSEILHVIDGIPGVDHVLELSLNAAGGEPQCGNVAVCPTWLVAPGAHQIDIV